MTPSKIPLRDSILPVRKNIIRNAVTAAAQPSSAIRRAGINKKISSNCWAVSCACVTEYVLAPERNALVITYPSPIMLRPTNDDIIINIFRKQVVRIPYFALQATKGKQ